MSTSTRHSDGGFTLIELLIVVVIIGILATIAIPKFNNSKERAIISQMRSDLRNMVTAQESYIADALTYYNGPIPSPTMAYGPSANVTITLSSVTNTGWAAVASSTSTLRTCAIFMGTAAPPAPATTPGIAACTP
ncbi:MAG TPA: prepilin-type N-terminal cleavage/methylation domain-containing protein [Gemmatimonadales bacterium]|nr:prepilin-type N-terminal cleavage/methylation domain-containing protein [Gemmatimonadales bacterium]